MEIDKIEHKTVNAHDNADRCGYEGSNFRRNADDGFGLRPAEFLLPQSPEGESRNVLGKDWLPKP